MSRQSRMNKRAKSVPELVRAFERRTGIKYERLQGMLAGDSKSVSVGESLPTPPFQYRLVTMMGSEVIGHTAWYSFENEQLSERVETGVIPDLIQDLKKKPKGSISYGLIRFEYPDGDWIVASSEVSTETLRKVVAIRSEDVHQDLKFLSELSVVVSSNLFEGPVRRYVGDEWTFRCPDTGECILPFTARIPESSQEPSKQTRGDKKRYKTCSSAIPSRLKLPNARKPRGFRVPS